MRTETPRIRQLTLQLEHAPYVLTRRALPAEADAPSHPLSRRPLEKSYLHSCRLPDGPYTDMSILSHAREGERRFVSSANAELLAREN